MDAVSRKYDILVWGASSFTGMRLVEYLALNSPKGTRIAIGGRNKDKIKDIRSRLATKIPDAAINVSEMDILIGDSLNSEQMHAIAAQTRVVASTVGPFAIYGEQLVRACVEEKTDYCDITAEMPWVRQMHSELNDRAVRGDVHIVPLCGFDCIPADLGCYMLAQYARNEFNEPLLHVKGSITGIRGGISGGTLATMTNQLGIEARRFSEKAMAFIRNKDSQQSRQSTNSKRSNRWVIHYDETLHRWQTFWVMSIVNQVTAKWAGKVLNYGPGFTYAESMCTRNLAQAILYGIGYLYGALLMFFAFTRSIIYALRIIPRPGEGPSEEFIKTGYFSLHLEAFSENRVFYGKVSGSSDPGYGETAKYLGESALCLAFDRDQGFRPGIYPPSVAMGSALLKRLRAKDCQFDIANKPIAAFSTTSRQRKQL
ncbi:hypothetical protein H4R20_003178 [Coemansia guatemalensis]|uniref:Saccharopine dehydrogenase NADP binding domain-containing protein n=1 Tax=Coemansia guatemalensis TaxID=2761395 RepID=A0A9W8HW51_9FUNG|nr:hypothetical protein H4R20_003178 [Coemansia guatemalensis]